VSRYLDEAEVVVVAILLVGDDSAFCVIDKIKVVVEPDTATVV